MKKGKTYTRKTPPILQKRITNTSLQGWNIPIRTASGYSSLYLAPKQSLIVPESYLTEDMIRYQQRNLITIKNA